MFCVNLHHTLDFEVCEAQVAIDAATQEQELQPAIQAIRSLLVLCLKTPIAQQVDLQDMIESISAQPSSASELINKKLQYYSCLHDIRGQLQDESVLGNLQIVATRDFIGQLLTCYAQCFGIAVQSFQYSNQRLAVHLVLPLTIVSNQQALRNALVTFKKKTQHFLPTAEICIAYSVSETVALPAVVTSSNDAYRADEVLQRTIEVALHDCLHEDPMKIQNIDWQSFPVEVMISTLLPVESPGYIQLVQQIISVFKEHGITTNPVITHYDDALDEFIDDNEDDEADDTFWRGDVW